MLDFLEGDEDASDLLELACHLVDPALDQIEGLGGLFDSFEIGELVFYFFFLFRACEED